MKPNDGTCWLWIQLETNQNKLQGVSILPQITFIHSQNASHKANKQNSYKWRWQKAQHKMNHLQFIFPTKVMLEESILLLKPSRCKQETEGTHTWKQPWVMRCFETISALSSPALKQWRFTERCFFPLMIPSSTCGMSTQHLTQPSYWCAWDSSPVSTRLDLGQRSH